MSQFHKKMEKTRSSFCLSLFSSLTDSLDFVNKSSKSPRNFGNGGGGGVGLGIVAAMDDDDSGAKVSSFLSLKKPASYFKEGGFGLLNLDAGTGGVVVVDENDDCYTCVISGVGNNVKKRVYYGDKVCNMCDVMVDSGQTCAGLSPVMRVMKVGAEEKREFWSRDFLSSCYLCKRVLHGMDVFMYRGEKSFCSPECRDTHIGREDFKEKCRSKAQKKQQDCSITPCSSPLLFLAGVAVA